MEYRKLIKFGNSAHVVSLPNNWIRKNNLNKGDLIYFNENGDNELVFFPKPEQSDKKEENKYVLDASNKSLQDIKRELISGYIAGFNTIEIFDKNPSLRKETKQIIKDLIGFELMEETQNKIVAKDLLSESDISIPTIIRRMDLLIKNIITEFKSCRNNCNLDQIYEKDYEINRLTYLALRILKMALDNPSIAKKLNISNVEILNYWQIITYLEKIGDEAKRTARFCTKPKLKKDEFNGLIKIYSEIEIDYDNMMKAYYNNDKQNAFKISGERSKVIEACDIYFDTYKNPVIGRIVEKLRGMETHIRNIGRVIYQ